MNQFDPLKTLAFVVGGGLSGALGAIVSFSGFVMYNAADTAGDYALAIGAGIVGVTIATIGSVASYVQEEAIGSGAALIAFFGASALMTATPDDVSTHIARIVEPDAVCHNTRYENVRCYKQG